MILVTNKKYHNRDWLFDQYWNLGKILKEIAKECNTTTTTIHN